MRCSMCSPHLHLYLRNLQGDKTAILNGSGAAVVTYSYDAWGQGRRKPSPCRFSRADLSRYFVAALENTEVFPAGCASSQPKSAP